jgi:hypothetical protein
MTPVDTKPRQNKARLDNRWGSLLSSMIFSNSDINPALDAQRRPSGASAWVVRPTNSATRPMKLMSTVDEDIQTITRHSRTLRGALTQRFGRQMHYTRDQLEAVFVEGVVPSTFQAYGIAMFAEPSERPGFLQRIRSSKTAQELRKWLIVEIFFYYLPRGSAPDDLDFHEVIDSTADACSDSASDFDGGDDGDWPHRAGEATLQQEQHPPTNEGEQGRGGKPPGSSLSAMTLLNSNPRPTFHARPRPEAASAWVDQIVAPWGEQFSILTARASAFIRVHPGFYFPFWQ